MSTAILDGVSKTFGRTTALRRTDLELANGVIGLLGPNGAGKTTMLRLLATSLPPTTGRIVVAGHEVTGSMAQRKAARRCLGYLPQEVTFPRGMTAFTFLDYVAVLKEWNITATRHREVGRVLDLVQLGDRATRRISKLSGGQRRRLAVAQALMGSPELVILDEPTTGLDPEQRASLRRILSGLARAGAVLLSTHQTEDVSALCDRVIVLDDGAIMFDGTVADLIEVARGRVHVSPEASLSAVTSWRSGTGAVRSVGGIPGPNATLVEPTVEDAYLLLRGQQTDHEGALS
ncbi:MAG TPA: ATP-binding cassette domain-containing protein [Nocardioides sp.]|nr:ATP-binding cassette domain-containing protein [Nocardioides sp.]